MKDNKVERIRQKAMLFGRQFLQGDTGIFDHALGDHTTATVMSAHPPGYRDRIYAPLDTLRLFVGQVLSVIRVRLWLLCYFENLANLSPWLANPASTLTAPSTM